MRTNLNLHARTRWNGLKPAATATNRAGTRWLTITVPDGHAGVAEATVFFHPTDDEFIGEMIEALDSLRSHA